VLSLDEAPQHPHNVARATFEEHHGVVQPSPAPRFSRTPGALGRSPAVPGAHTDEVLVERGFTSDDLVRLHVAGVLR
jgi:alpha-methylacyl-CoA racemase